MASVIFVHGIGQERHHADGGAALGESWRVALQNAIRTCRGTEAALAFQDVSVAMTFYGDLFLAHAGMQGVEDLDVDSEIVRALAAEWVARAEASARSPDDRREARRVQPELDAEVQGTGAVARTAVEALCRMRWFAQAGFSAVAAVNRALRQVSAYLGDDQTIRNRVRDRVLALTGQDTVAIVGHSLGSVVAFEVAHLLDRPLPLLVTMGSPLGIRNIVYDRLDPQPPTFPTSVRHWLNVADRDDIVAARPDLSSLFRPPPGATFDADERADNRSEPHDATRYLSAQSVALAVSTATSGVPLAAGAMTETRRGPRTSQP